MKDAVMRVLLAKLICRCFGWKFVLSVEEGFHYREGTPGFSDDEFISWEDAAHLDIDNWLGR